LKKNSVHREEFKKLVKCILVSSSFGKIGQKSKKGFAVFFTFLKISQWKVEKEKNEKKDSKRIYCSTLFKGILGLLFLEMF